MEEKKQIKVSLGAVISVFIIILLSMALVGMYCYYNFIVIPKYEVTNNKTENIIENEQNNVNSDNNDIEKENTNQIEDENKNVIETEVKEYDYELVGNEKYAPFGFCVNFYNGKFYMTIDDNGENSIKGTYEEKNDTIICNIQTWHSGFESDYAYYTDSEANGEIKLKRLNDNMLEIDSFSEIKGKVIVSDENGKEKDNGFKNLKFELKKGDKFELKETRSFEIGQYKIENHSENIVFNSDYTCDLYLGGENRISGTFMLLTDTQIDIYFEEFYGKYTNEHYNGVKAILQEKDDSTLQVHSIPVYTKTIKDGEIERVVEIFESEFLPFESGVKLIKEK